MYGYQQYQPTNYIAQTNSPLYTPFAGVQKHEVVRVNGRNGAEAFQMAPNSSVLLLDETAPIVWLKVTDGASYPTLTPYEIKPYEPKPTAESVTQLEELKKRIERIEAKLSEQSDVANAK